LAYKQLILREIGETNGGAWAVARRVNAGAAPAYLKFRHSMRFDQNGVRVRL
jgi:hypothetical protein